MGDSLRGVFDGLVDPARITVVPNGTPKPSIDRTNRDPSHVVFLSNLRRRKGVVEALDAALLVLSQVPSARFSFVGSWEDDELEHELRRKAAPFANAIAFHPPVSGTEKYSYLESASILLFPPTRPEGHPRVVLEALSASLPVVTTNQGAIAETVGNNVAGFVLPRSEPRELAQCVRRLLLDDSLRERMGNAAAARYEECFTQEIADQRLAAWLMSVSGPGCDS
jgi:glycosyltransferase involved in cell wall biosynthesis